MSESIVEVMVRGGVVSADALAEFRRWKVPGVPAELPVPAPVDTLEEATAALIELRSGVERVLQDRDLVLPRVTDPDLLAQYTNTRFEGTLHVETGTEQADFQMIFGRTARGEYIIPWSSEALEDVLERGEAWIVQPEEVHFVSTNTFSYGPDKAFIVCIPAVTGAA